MRSLLLLAAVTLVAATEQPAYHQQEKNEPHQKDRDLQVMLCRCEKKKENLYNRRALRKDQSGRSLQTQDAAGFFIVNGVRVLPLADQDCGRQKQKKNKRNIFDRDKRQLRGNNAEHEGEEAEEDYGDELEEKTEIDTTEISPRRRLRGERSFICRSSVLGASNPLNDFVANVAIGIVDSTTGNIASQQDVTDFVEDIAIGIIDSTGASGLISQEGVGGLVGNVLVTQGEISDMVEGIADGIQAASGGNVGTIITNEQFNDIVDDVADSIEAQTGVPIDNGLLDPPTQGGGGGSFSPYAVFVDTTGSNPATFNPGAYTLPQFPPIAVPGIPPFNPVVPVPPFIPSVVPVPPFIPPPFVPGLPTFPIPVAPGPITGTNFANADTTFSASPGGGGGAYGYASGFFQLNGGPLQIVTDTSTSP